MPPMELEDQNTPTTDASDTDKGGGVDYEALFEQTTADLEATKSELQNTRSEFESVKKTAGATSERLEKLRAALSDDDGKGQVDPTEAAIAELELEADEYLQAKYELSLIHI